MCPPPPTWRKRRRRRKGGGAWEKENKKEETGKKKKEEEREARRNSRNEEGGGRTKRKRSKSMQAGTPGQAGTETKESRIHRKTAATATFFLGGGGGISGHNCSSHMHCIGLLFTDVWNPFNYAILPSSGCWNFLKALLLQQLTCCTFMWLGKVHECRHDFPSSFCESAVASTPFLFWWWRQKHHEGIKGRGRRHVDGGRGE